MKRAGHVALMQFPYADQEGSKLRPVLLLCRASRHFDDWLVCMISSRIYQKEEGFDELIDPSDADFSSSGLKVTSVIRLARLAVVEGACLKGAIGVIGETRLAEIRRRLARWIESGSTA